MAMTLEFLDGCSHYAATEILQKWHSGSATKSATTPHGTGESLLSPNLLRRNYPAGAEGIVTCTFRLPSIASNQSIVRIFVGTGTPTIQLELFVQTTGVPRVFRGGSVPIGGSGPVLAINTWYFVEFAWLISDTVGTLDLRFYDTAGTLLGSIASTALDTKQSATETTADAIIFNSSGNFFKDIHLWTGTGYTTADFNGPSKIETLRPSAAGPDADWTIGGTAPEATNHESVDDVDADEALTLVQTSGVGDRDTHELEELISTVNTIHAVQQVAQHRKDDTAARGIKLSYRNPGGSYFDSAEFVQPADWTMDLNPMEVSPDTGVAWTRSEINDGRHGFVLST